MIIVIGGGPAGRIGAMRLAEGGSEVRLIERRKIGGQCLHDRCMMVCALNDVARLLDCARVMRDLGIVDTVPAVSYPTVKRRMREIQEKLGLVLDAETRRAGVEVVYGAEGRVSGDRVYIDDEEVRADAVLAATGSRAAIPDDIPGVDLAGVSIHEETAVASIEGGARVRSVLLGSGEEIEADAVLLATGLVPRSESLQGLSKRPDGAVIVDRHMRTSVARIYAAGDVIGPPYLTPAARREGVVAAENILGHPTVMDYAGIPQTMNLRYDYAIATIGTDDGSVSLSAPAPAGPGSFWDVARGWSGVAQIRVNPETGRLVSAAAGVPGAPAIISYIGYLMKRGVTVSDFEDLVEVHPSTDGIYGLARYAAGLLRKKKSEPPG